MWHRVFGNGSLKALYDRSDGFFRRQIILSTRRRPKDRIDDPYLSEKLVSEKEGIFLWCLEATNNIYASGGKRVRGFLGIRLLQRGYP